MKAVPGDGFRRQCRNSAPLTLFFFLRPVKTFAIWVFLDRLGTSPLLLTCLHKYDMLVPEKMRGEKDLKEEINN
jgi:hypothetical protein